MIPSFPTRICCIAPAAACILFALTHAADGGLIGERSWRVVSEDNQYVLVIISPQSASKERNGYADWPERQLEVREIRAKYVKSGLYRNDGSSEPMWTMPYRLPVYDVYISPDGRQVLLANETWDHNISNIRRGGSLLFYDKRGLIVGYEDHELIWCWELKRLANLTAGRGLILCENASFDPAALTYTLATSQSEELVFDITTGEIIRRRSVWPIYLIVIFFGVPGLVIGYYRIRRRRATERTGRSRLMQFSLQSFLLVVTATCVFLACMSFNALLTIASVLLGLLGGGIAWLRTKNHKAGLVGAVLSLYGGFVGFVIWSRLADFSVLSLTEGRAPLASMGALAFLVLFGATTGGLTAGRLERKAFA